MIDGKFCHTLTDTKSTQSCYNICHAKPKEMNDLKNINNKLANIENYSFGLSTLHSWIRFFECCLHVSYRMEIKSWQAKGENKTKMELRKKQIIDGLRKELGIMVDQPKPGYGSTNTGNTARVFLNMQNSHKKLRVLIKTSYKHSTQFFKPSLADMKLSQKNLKPMLWKQQRSLLICILGFIRLQASIKC